jgi:hypothetical protein
MKITPKILKGMVEGSVLLEDAIKDGMTPLAFAQCMTLVALRKGEQRAVIALGMLVLLVEKEKPTWEEILAS